MDSCFRIIISLLNTLKCFPNKISLPSLSNISWVMIVIEFFGKYKSGKG